MTTRCFSPISLSQTQPRLNYYHLIYGGFFTFVAEESGHMRVRDFDARFQLQKNTLRFLCSVLIKSGTRAEICKLLDPDVFDDPMHRVVFEEIRDMGSIDSRRLRELLPTRVASRGFPDFDLRKLLAPYEVSEKEIDHLFESALQLLDLSNPDEERRVH